MRDDGGTAVVEHDLGIHVLHCSRGQVAADGVQRLGKRRALALEDALVDDRRDVLIPEDVLGVAQNRVVARQQLAVGGEDRDRVDSVLVQCEVLVADQVGDELRAEHDGHQSP